MNTALLSASLPVHHDTVRTVLPNGLTLMVRRDTSAPVVAIVTNVKVGYFDEPDELSGIAHVLEHMYFKGTPSRGVGEIARDTKALGGYLNAGTIYDHTSYYTVLPSSAFVHGLDIQFDAYAHSSIDATELSRELEVIVQEAKRKRDSPSAVAIETLYAVLHDHHRIRRWRIGEEEGLRALTQRDVTDFYRRWYRPSNTVLSIVGDIDPDTVYREVINRYGTLSGQSVARVPGPVEQAQPGVRYRDMERDVAQHHVAMGWRGLPMEHNDTPALDLAGIALGTGRASRLYRAVRDRQLASSVSSWHYNAGDVGVFTVHAEGPAQHARTAMQRAWFELQSARTKGFRTHEVIRAQRMVEARWLRRLETMDGQASYLATWEANGGLERAAEYYDRVLSLHPDALQRAVETHLAPDQLSVVSVRPTGGDPLASDVSALHHMLAASGSAAANGHTTTAVATPLHVAAFAGDATSDNATTIAAPAANRLHATPGGPAGGELIDGVHVHVLDGGVTLLILPRSGSPLVTIGVYQRGGSGLEADGEEGVARLTAHTMLKGTVSRSGGQIAEAAEELGASIGVSTAQESIGWSLSVPKRGLSAAIALLADVTQHPVFPDDGVQVERGLALAEFSRLRDDMYRWPMRMATEAAFAGHAYARSTLGTFESLSSLTADSLRRFHHQHVLRGATVIAVAGDVVAGDVVACVEREFSQLRFVQDPPVPMAPWPDRALRIDDAREKQQTAMVLLFPGASRRSELRYAARVTSAIASGLGGRFFEQLRDRQSLAYTIAAFPIERRAGGAFGTYIATSPEREAEAREGLLSECEKFRAAPPLAEELHRARQYLAGTHAIGQQTGAAVLGELVDAFLFGRGIDERHDIVPRILGVTADDVMAFAAQTFVPERMVEGVVRGVRAPTQSPQR